MKRPIIFLTILLASFYLISCQAKRSTDKVNIIFLHHSTGGVIWKGNTINLIHKSLSKISQRLATAIAPNGQIQTQIEQYNKTHGTRYRIQDRVFPKAHPYGWNNYPYDYYNIWVRNGGTDSFMEEPTLELLTKEYQVIIFKHCFPVSNIQKDLDNSNINSDIKTLENYKLQYYALRDKLQQFPEVMFIIFTGAAQVELLITEDEAERAKEFFHWVITDWDIMNDNIFLWDLYNLQTEGGLYFKNEYAVSPHDSHPNMEFAGRVANLLVQRIVDVIETRGALTNHMGLSLDVKPE